MMIFWGLFVGIGAVAGAAEMIFDPSGRSMGMDAMLPYFKVLPFADVLFCDLFFSGMALLAVNGVPNLVAVVLMTAKKRAGVVMGGVCGVLLMLWICIQFYMFPLNFMSTAFFIIGAAQAATGYAACVFERQERFAVDTREYPNVGTDHDRLVVYFSRMGYTKKLAYEEAERTGAEIAEIRAAERTEGTAGFWWCGRYAMHRWDMPIVMPEAELEKYSHVTLCTPIWVFATAATVRTFCRRAKGRIKSVDYIIVHHTGGAYENAAREMDELLGIRRTSFRSVRCRMGRYREVKTDKTARGDIKN